MATKPRTAEGLPVGVSPSDRIDVQPEFEAVLEMAQKSARSGSVPAYVLLTLKAAVDDAFDSVPDKSLRSNPPPAWEPTEDLIWKSSMKRADGKRLSAWQFFQERYLPIPREERPYAHQVRQHPKTKEFYETLCVFVSRNKAKNVRPATIGELFPVSDEARGGMLSARPSER